MWHMILSEVMLQFPTPEPTYYPNRKKHDVTKQQIPPEYPIVHLFAGQIR